MSRLLNGGIIAVIASGITIAVIGGHTLRWSPPPIPPRWAAGHSGAAVDRPRLPGRKPAALARSAPTSIDIPAIGVHARIIRLGLTSHDRLQTPPLSHPFLAGWYDRGPTPGQRGAAVIVGHVDAASVGPAVFYKLGLLRPGDRILVRLADRRTARFVVTSADLYQKVSFPDDTVYGPTSWPTLRLVTCGGVFDRQTGHYLANTVIFASYAGHR